MTHIEIRQKAKKALVGVLYPHETKTERKKRRRREKELVKAPFTLKVAKQLEATIS